MSLVSFLESMEDQEEEMSKLAAEEDAAGRIMARGFMDELAKIARYAKVQFDSSGKRSYKPAYVPQKSPPPPKFKPGSGYKPTGGSKTVGGTAGSSDALKAGKKAMKRGYKGVGSQGGQRKALRREGVFGI